MAIARAISDTMPIACEGKNLWKGKRKPVTLVATVVARNRAVQPSSLFPVSNPYATTIPEKIPIKLNTTCTKVSVVMPKIIMPPSSFSRPNGSVPHSLDRFLLMRDVHVAAVKATLRLRNPIPAFAFVRTKAIRFGYGLRERIPRHSSFLHRGHSIARANFPFKILLNMTTRHVERWSGSSSVFHRYLG